MKEGWHLYNSISDHIHSFADYCLSVITDNYQKLSGTVKQDLTPEMLKEIKKAFSSAYVPRAVP